MYKNRKNCFVWNQRYMTLHPMLTDKQQSTGKQKLQRYDVPIPTERSCLRSFEFCICDLYEKVFNVRDTKYRFVIVFAGLSRIVCKLYSVCEHALMTYVFINIIISFYFLLPICGRSSVVLETKF